MLWHCKNVMLLRDYNFNWFVIAVAIVLSYINTTFSFCLKTIKWVGTISFACSAVWFGAAESVLYPLSRNWYLTVMSLVTPEPLTWSALYHSVSTFETRVQWWPHHKAEWRCTGSGSLQSDSEIAIAKAAIPYFKVTFKLQWPQLTPIYRSVKVRNSCSTVTTP